MSLLRKVNAEKYSEGQVWSYKTRRGEEESKLIIVKIEKDMRQRKIFHLCIEKVRIKNPRVAGGFSSYIAHIPVSEKILDEDCLKVVDIRKIFQIFQIIIKNGRIRRVVFLQFL